MGNAKSDETRVLCERSISMTLNEIQQALKAPKGQRNTFANYNYRSCEDILEAVKPLLGKSTLIISDEVVHLGDRYYVKATVTLACGQMGITHQVSGYAREPLDRKGMDESQVSGMASSYARKYALNGLFCIDDTKDADTMDNSAKPAKKPAPIPNFAKTGAESVALMKTAYTQILDKHGKRVPPGFDFDFDKFVLAIQREFSKLPTNPASIPLIVEKITALFEKAPDQLLVEAK